MFRHYYRTMNKGQFRPIGLVCMDTIYNNNKADLVIGWSLCNNAPDPANNNKGDSFNKKTAYRIAIQDSRLKYVNFTDAAAVFETIQTLPHSLHETAVKLYLKLLRYRMLNKTLISGPINDSAKTEPTSRNIHGPASAAD